MWLIFTASIAIVAVLAYLVGQDRGRKSIEDKIEKIQIMEYAIASFPEDRLRENLMKKVEEEFVSSGMIKYIEEDGIRAIKITFYRWKKKNQ